MKTGRGLGERDGYCKQSAGVGGGGVLSWDCFYPSFCSEDSSRIGRVF